MSEQDRVILALVRARSIQALLYLRVICIEPCLVRDMLCGLIVPRRSLLLPRAVPILLRERPMLPTGCRAVVCLLVRVLTVLLGLILIRVLVDTRGYRGLRFWLAI